MRAITTPDKIIPSHVKPQILSPLQYKTSDTLAPEYNTRFRNQSLRYPPHLTATSKAQTRLSVVSIVGEW
jgi:hypothetical protein